MVAHIRTSKPNEPKLEPIDPKPPLTENHFSSSFTLTNKNDTQETFYWRKTESLRLLVQMILTLTVLIFCIGKLTTNDDDKALYWGGVMSLMAWWMPSPGGTTSSKLDK